MSLFGKSWDNGRSFGLHCGCTSPSVCSVFTQSSTANWWVQWIDWFPCPFVCKRALMLISKLSATILKLQKIIECYLKMSTTMFIFVSYNWILWSLHLLIIVWLDCFFMKIVNFVNWHKFFSTLKKVLHHHWARSFVYNGAEVKKLYICAYLTCCLMTFTHYVCGPDLGDLQRLAPYGNHLLRCYDFRKQFFG